MTERKKTIAPSELLFALLRSEICGTDEKLPQSISESTLNELYDVAKSQAVVHIVSNALHKREILGANAVSEKFLRAQMLAVYRCEQHKHALGEISAILEDNQIPYIPLKGSVLRDYYAEDWMRISCDIDILIHEEDLSRAIDALVSKAGYKTDNKLQYHDVSLYSPSGIHLELHFHIKEGMSNIDGLLTTVWEHSVRDCAETFCYHQTNAFFVFHHIAHMAYHFIHGGCGIKPFIDLYIINQKMDYDEKAVRAFCRQCGLEDFYCHVLYLTEVWFGNKLHTALSRQMAEYILNGGVYGTRENKELINRSKRKNKLKYAVSRIWMPYDILKTTYPIIVKHKWLFPFMQVRRWIAFVFGGKRKQSEQAVKDDCGVSKEQVSAMTEFLNEIGL